MINKNDERLEVLNSKGEGAGIKPVAKERFSESWYKHTETGIKFMPPQLAKHLAMTEKTIVLDDEFYFYENGVYRKKDNNKVDKIIKDSIDIDLLAIYRIVEVRKLWAIDRTICDEGVNKNDKLINFKNGLYDVTTNILNPHTPDYYSTIQLNVSFNEEVDCPVFKSWIKDRVNEEDIPLIQEMMGYIMIPNVRAQKMFILKGRGKTGKSTLLDIISEIIGEDNISNIPLQNLSDKFNTAELNDKLLNVFADLPKRSLCENSTLKALVSGDAITAQHKYKSLFNFRNTSRFIFSANELPLNPSDTSDGFYRRLLIISMDNVIKEMDSNVKDKLMLELDGIAMWSLQGLKRLVQNNYNFTESIAVENNLLEYKRENSSVEEFVSEKCSAKEGHKISTSELYNKYIKYCDEMGIDNCVKLIKFSSELKNVQGVMVKKARINNASLSTVFNLEYIGG